MILRIAAIGIVTVVSVLVVRNERSDIAALIGIVGGVAIILSVIDYFTEIVALLADLTDRTGINATLVGYLVKIVGAGYIIEFACDTAEDAKLPTLANKIALGGKVVIFCLTIPVVTELVNIVISLLSSYY